MQAIVGVMGEREDRRTASAFWCMHWRQARLLSAGVSGAAASRSGAVARGFNMASDCPRAAADTVPTPAITVIAAAATVANADKGSIEQ